MPYKVIISEEARLDYGNVTEEYFSINKKLGSRFISQLRKAQKYVTKNPYQFQIRYDHVRICFVKIFPFGVHYIVEGNSIIILALLHVADDPEKWNKRLAEVIKTKKSK